MAKKTHTTDEFINAVRMRASLPASSSLFSNDDITDYLTQELHNILTPITLDAREEYLVFDLDQNTVAEQEFYQIPANSIGTGLRKVVLIGTDNQEFDVPFISIDQKAGYRTVDYYADGITPDSYNGQVHHFFQGNYLGLYPKPKSSYAFRMKYYRRPNELVQEKDAANITSFNATQVLVNKVLDFQVGDIVEFNQARSPFSAYGSAVITAMPTTSTLEFAAVPDGISNGDWVSDENTSPVVNLPQEAQLVLIQSAVVKILSATGDETQTKMAGELYEQLKSRYVDVISPRGDGSIKKAVGANNIANYVSGRYGGFGSRNF